MSVTLVLEHAPHPQAETRRTVEAGELTIGRGTDADWQIDDPDMFVSRRHCVVSVSDGEAAVTDASRGGLFVDGADQPLGPGNRVSLEDGMRLRLGDFVLKVELDRDTSPEAPRIDSGRPQFKWDEPEPARRNGTGGAHFTWPEPEPPTATPQRPDDLPHPFEVATSGPVAPDAERTRFGFDWEGTGGPDPLPQESKQVDQAGSSVGFHEPTAESFSRGNAPGQTRPEPESPPEFAWPQQVARAERHQQRPAQAAGSGRPVASDNPFPDSPGPPEPPSGAFDRRSASAQGPEPAREIERAESAPPASEAALRDAFFRGLGLDPARHGGGDPMVEMEAMGVRFRMLVEGLRQMLHARAQEKQNVRVATTLIGSADVNPLKFAASTDDALVGLIGHRGPGYLPPDVAIGAAFRDLADHRLRTWSALQSSLRRMIDRFDPEAIETETEKAGLIDKLLAGGRSAKLWQIYCDHYRTIARSAEERFLGEVGADFRDAYEGNGRPT